ncbi:hypothetical protein FSARC_3609 [Fusarium sarcochroum]|uniref:Uncharacterized protein n=1 Tax=Fusarium sarcochroum TaxID=1208366 RepID=A0A8H4U3F3_9HYPO|nr:hypothetical protein FSARC_3609 [Fusarium sarcochroum]
MGGIVLDVSSLHDDYTLLTLTPEGLLYLAGKRHFIDVPDLTIKDKSRPDAFAKIVVVFQVVWMVLENCTRLDVGLPVTIIEGHTLIHVVTAVAMYILWFKKPLNVYDPTVIKPVAFKEHAALMLMRCTRLGGKASASMERQPRLRKDLSILDRIAIALLKIIGLRELAQDLEDKCFKLKRLTLRRSDTSESAYLINYLATTKEVKTEEEKKVLQRRGQNSPSTSSPVVTLPENSYRGPEAPRTTPDDIAGPQIHSSQVYDPSLKDTTPCKYIHAVEGQKSIGFIRAGQHLTCGIGPVSFKDSAVAIELSAKTVRRWEQAATIIKDTHVGIDEAAFYFVDGQLSNLPLPGGQGIRSLNTKDILILVLVFFVLCAGYGSVHCLAWNADFATQSEKNLWRIACVDLVMAGVLYFILFAFFLAAQDNGAHAVAHLVIIFLGLGHFVIYVGARIFLVVEAFMSVRHLPAEAYETVGWVSWIPHI